MILFRKPCDKCRNIKIVKSFQTTEEFFDIFEEMKTLLANDGYEYAGGNNPVDTIRY